jgi:hypothetical protein
VLSFQRDKEIPGRQLTLSLLTWGFRPRHMMQRPTIARTASPLLTKSTPKNITLSRSEDWMYEFNSIMS